MVWTQLKILWPSFVEYWIFLIVVLTPTLYFLSKSWPRITFSFSVPTTLATATVVIMAGNAWFNLTQNMVMYDYQQKEKAAQASTQGTGQPANAKQAAVDPALQMKSDFLKVVEQIANNPDKLTPELRTQVFSQYGKLFPKAEDKQAYMKNIMAVYNCQKYFWEDALSSYQAKKEIKSDARTECEKAPGVFFNREKLVTVETVKGNDETITKLAGHKRLPAAEGKTVDVDEGMLRTALEKQINSLAAIKALFQ